MKYNIWAFIWDTIAVGYKYTGIRIHAPIEYFFPNFSIWLFEKMVGVKDILVRKDGKLKEET